MNMNMKENEMKTSIQNIVTTMYKAYYKRIEELENSETKKELISYVDVQGFYNNAIRYFYSYSSKDREREFLDMNEQTENNIKNFTNEVLSDMMQVYGDNETTNDFTVNLNNVVFNYLKDNTDMPLRCDASTQSLLSYLLSILTRQLYKNTTDTVTASRIVILTSKYMKDTEQTHRDRAIKELDKNLNVLNQLHFKFTYNRKKKDADKKSRKKTDYEDVTVQSCIVSSFSRPAKNEMWWEVNFDIAFCEYLQSKQIMDYTEQVFKINNRYYPYATYFCNRLFQHYNMNKRKKNANIISMNTILKSMTKLYYENDEITSDCNLNTDTRYYKQRCLDVVNKNLNHLIDKDILSSWHYIDENNTDNKDYIPANRQSFLNSKIAFKLKIQ